MIAIALWPDWWGADQAVFICLMILVILIAIFVPIGPVGTDLPYRKKVEDEDEPPVSS